MAAIGGKKFDVTETEASRDGGQGVLFGRQISSDFADHDVGLRSPRMKRSEQRCQGDQYDDPGPAPR